MHVLCMSTAASCRALALPCSGPRAPIARHLLTCLSRPSPCLTSPSQEVAAPYAGELLELGDARSQGSLLLGQLQQQATELGQAAAAMPLRVQARGWAGLAVGKGWCSAVQPGAPAPAKRSCWWVSCHQLTPARSPAPPLWLPQKMESTMALLETGDLKLRVRVLEAERAARRAGVVQVRGAWGGAVPYWRYRTVPTEGGMGLQVFGEGRRQGGILGSDGTLAHPRVCALTHRLLPPRSSHHQAATINTICSMGMLNVGVQLGLAGQTTAAGAALALAAGCGGLVVFGFRRVQRLDKFEKSIKTGTRYDPNS